MPPTLGLVANVYNEVNALPGWLETHLPHFDDVTIYHAGPQGAESNDGTMELLRRWGVPVVMGSIDAGFGVVRTAAIRSSPCEYVVLLDADERLHPLAWVLTCRGNATPQHEVDRILGTYDFRDGRRPDWGEVAKLGANLTVERGPAYDQIGYLREVIESERPDAVITPRRHWHGLGRGPTQNWNSDPDWQMRIVRNHPDIYFATETRMHERLVGAERVVRADMVRGPFFDHYHFAFKRMEQDQRSHDLRIYDAINDGRTPPTADLVR